MRKIVWIILPFLLFEFNAAAQPDTLSSQDQAILDSLITYDPFLQLLQDLKPKDACYFSVGAGNGGFTSQNNVANATGYVNQLILMPQFTYISKGGISLGLTGFLTSDSVKTADLYQLGISAGYTHKNKKINFGASYTRYLRTTAAYNSRSIYQNDLYGFIRKAKGKIIPGLTLGYVTGEHKEWQWLKYQRTVHLPLPLPFGRDTIVTGHVKDSMTNTTKYFSLTADARHEFSFFKIFSKKDMLDFTPAVLVNFGSSGLTQEHTSAIFSRSRILSRYQKAELTDAFQMQSLGLSLDAIYSLKKFFIEPNVYVDYFVPTTTRNRWSAVFSLSVGFSL